MITGLLTSGYLCDQTWPYYTTIGLVAAHLAQQIYSLNIDNPADCAKKFISNHQVGFLIFAGIVLGSYLKVSQDNTTASNAPSTASSSIMKWSKEKLHVT